MSANPTDSTTSTSTVNNHSANHNNQNSNNLPQTTQKQSIWGNANFDSSASASNSQATSNGNSGASTPAKTKTDQNQSQPVTTNNTKPIVPTTQGIQYIPSFYQPHPGYNIGPQLFAQNGGQYVSNTFFNPFSSDKL